MISPDGMRNAPIAGMVTPADRARVLQSVKLSADLGRELADLAALVFGAAMPTSIRALFDEHLSMSLPDLFADWHGMPDEDRAYLGKVAAMVFDRRLARHASSPRLRGRLA